MEATGQKHRPHIEVGKCAVEEEEEEEEEEGAYSLHVYMVGTVWMCVQ